jgi:hypothetical protein
MRLGIKNEFDNVPQTAGGPGFSAGLPSTNLQNRRIKLPGRTVPAVGSCWPSDTAALRSYVGGPFTTTGRRFDLYGLLNVVPFDLSPLRFLRAFRVRHAETGTLGTDVYRAATSTAGVTNLSGGVGALAGDLFKISQATWMTATTPASTIAARFQFSGTPALKTGTGANLQRFYITVRRPPGIAAATITVELYQSGVAKSTLITAQAVSADNSTAQTFLCTWNASLLTTPSAAAGVECRVTSGTAGLQVGLVLWVAELAGLAYDPGEEAWVYPADTGIYGTGGDLPSHWIHAGASPIAPVVGHSYLMEFIMDWAPGAYFQAARAWCGQAFIPSYSMDLDYKTRVVDSSVISQSLDGTEWADVKTPWRESDVTLSNLTETEAYSGLFERLDRRKGVTGDVLFVPQPDTPAQFVNQNLYGRVSSLGTVEGTGFGAGELRFRRSFTIREAV